MTTELITVTAQIPANRVPEFYEMVARLNRLASGPNGQSLRPWAKGDERLAKQAFAACSSHARQILKYLADRPGQQVLGAQIALDLNMPKGHMAVAGVVTSISVQCRKVGHDMPYTTSYREGATAACYTMPQEVAELFRAAAATDRG